MTTHFGSQGRSSLTGFTVSYFLSSTMPKGDGEEDDKNDEDDKKNDDEERENDDVIKSEGKC